MLCVATARLQISIHALRMESDTIICGWCNATAAFLSTLSAWRATGQTKRKLIFEKFLSTLSAWRATLISYSIYVARSVFLSTLSAWRATIDAAKVIYNETISIHALRMESDAEQIDTLLSQHISIHALRMESDCLLVCIPVRLVAIFLSTLSAWRATSTTKRSIMI